MSRFSRLRVEVMEDRLAPAVLSVVHPSLANGTSTFPTLATAQSAFATGDVIQIEPGSSPGGMGIANLAGQTIRGNPAFAADALPVVTVSLGGELAQTNVTLRNLNVVFGQSLTIAGAGWTMDGCSVANSFSVAATESLIDLNSTGTTLRSNRFNSIIGVVGGNVVGVTPPAGGSGNLITDNTFFALSDLNLIEYQPVPLRFISDRVVNNTFLGQSTANSTAALLAVVGGSNLSGQTFGLVISGNTFTDNSTTAQTAITIDVPTAEVTRFDVRNNRISFPNSVAGSANIGIRVSSASGFPRAVILSHNDIATKGNGVGIMVVANATAANDLSVKVEGNDLHHNRIGIHLLGTGSGSFATGVDLGGGTSGSLGLNNFRGFTATASSTFGAVVIGTGFTAFQSVNVRSNLWGVANPETVIRDSGDDTALNADLAPSSPLTANQSAVAALYHTFLRRSAVFSNASDAGGWVTQLTNGTPFPTVATSITRSAEALGLVVDKLYKSILGRDADAGGRATHVNLIVNGATVEQIQSAFFASAEYTLRYAGNVAFVHSLYQTLLGRIPSQAEVDSQVANLPSQGRQGMAASFLASTEYRNREVTALYFDVLKRATPPTAGEVSANVNSGLDLLALRVLFATTAEFFANG